MTTNNASIKALRELNRNQEVARRDAYKHIRQLMGKNDRLVAVVGGSIVELNLRKLLEKAFANGPGKLFDIQQPLSSFSSKIELSYSLGLIDQEIKKNAHYIREIRNVFAHRAPPTSFKLKEIIDVCELFSYGTFPITAKLKEHSRGKFVAACLSIVVCISDFRVNDSAQPPVTLHDKWLERSPRNRPSSHHH